MIKYMKNQRNENKARLAVRLHILRILEIAKMINLEIPPFSQKLISPDLK